MKYLCLIVCLGLCGCQSWQSGSALPGVGLSKKEKQIVNRVGDDPFPTPQQVGIGPR